nr:zinc finger, PMZ-type [Tanacetum cinerariifolium]
IDDPLLNKLVGKGRFVGKMEDPIPGLKGRFFVEQNDPDENFVEPKYKVQKDFQYPCFDPDTPWNECKPVLGMKFESPSQLKQCLANYGVTHGYQLRYMQNDTYKLLVKYGRDVSARKCAGKRGKKQVQIKDSLNKDKGKDGEWSSYKDLGKGSAGGSSDKGKGKLGKDRSKPSKLNDRAGLTVISDGHKGLLEAVKIWLPDTEHRQCTRHIYANFKKKWSGLQFKRLFWKAAASSMNEQFLKVIEEIKALDENAYTWKWVVYASGFQEIEVRRQDKAFGVNIHLKNVDDIPKYKEDLVIPESSSGNKRKEPPVKKTSSQVNEASGSKNLVKKDAKNKAMEAEMWRETYEEEKYWEEYASEFKDWEFREEQENIIRIMLSVDDEHIIGNTEPVNPAEQTHVIASASSAPVDEQPETSQDPSTEKVGSSADLIKKANKRKKKADSEQPLPFRIYHKNKGRSERIANLQAKKFKFDANGTGTTPEKTFDVSD